MEVGNQWSEEPKVLHGEAKNLFVERFRAMLDYGVCLDEIDFKTIPL